MNAEMVAFIDSTFASYEEFEENFNLFKAENSVTFRKKTSETVAKANAKSVAEIPPHFVYSRVEFTCTHFGQPKYRGNGVKSKTKHTATGCEAKFVLKYDYYEKVLHISKAHLEHNHPTTPETYSQEYQVKRLTQTQRKTLQEIVDLNPQNEKLMRLVNAKFNKAFTLSEIRRLKHQSLSGRIVDDMKELLDNLEGLQVHAQVRVSLSDNGAERLLDMVAFSTTSMVAIFKKFVLTCGANKELCIWEGIDDTDTTSVKLEYEPFALAYQDGRIFTSTAGNLIQINTFPDGVRDGIATRFNTPCRHFCISKDGRILVAGSDEFKIKVISMEEQDCNCVFDRHQAPILSVAIDPQGDFVASSSCDGTVKVWDATDGSPEMSLDLLTPCNHPSQANYMCRLTWSHDGEFLLVPVKNTVQILIRSSWAVTQTIESTQLKENINVMALSEDGQHIAVGCMNGDIGIFDWQKRSLIEKHSHPKNLTITSIAWNPGKPTQLAFCDNMGQLGFLEDLQTIPKRNPDDVEMPPEITNGGFDAMDDDDMLVSSSNQLLPGVNGDIGIDDENSIDLGTIKQKYNFGEDGDDDAGSVSSKVDPLLTNNTPSPMPRLPPMDVFKPTPLQPPFQPGSTPEHLSSRFMVWNDIGIVRQNISEEDDDNSIDVEFHSAATHHALHIDNNSDFVMADLSSQALLLASRGDEETPSNLLCMHFGSWDSDKEWSVNMPENENIQAITAADKWVAIASESRTVRIFTVGGMQCQVFSLPGNVVTMASHMDRLVVAYHKGMGIPGDQFMGVTVLRVRGNARNTLVKDETLPLSPGSRLSWLGFTDEGLPLYMDTEGIIRLLHKGFNQLWCPVANTRQQAKGKSDHFWVVGVNLRQQQIRCIPCKGSRYPATLPRPALSVISFELPMCDKASEKSSYEESYQRSLLLSKNLLSHDTADSELEEELMTSLRESVIKLFALAAKGEKDFRALEVCEMIEEPGVLEIAATYATRLRRTQLAERVSEVLSRRQTMFQDAEDDDDDKEEEGATEDVWNTEETDRNQVQSEEEVEEEVVSTENDVTESPGTMLKINKEKATPKTTPSQAKNPFKIFSSAQSASKGSQVFDKIQKHTPKPSPVIAPLPVTIKKSGKKANSSQGNQCKLTGFGKGEKPVTIKKESSGAVKKDTDQSVELSENQPVKKKVSALDLWREANKDELREEHPDLSEEDLGQAAAEAFRALSKEERQTWVQKAKGLISTTEEDSTRKRKLSDEDATEDTESAKGMSKQIKSEKKTPLSQTTNAKLAKFAKVD